MKAAKSDSGEVGAAEHPLAGGGYVSVTDTRAWKCNVKIGFSQQVGTSASIEGESENLNEMSSVVHRDG